MGYSACVCYTLSLLLLYSMGVRQVEGQDQIVMRAQQVPAAVAEGQGMTLMCTVTTNSSNSILWMDPKGKTQSIGCTNYFWKRLAYTIATCDLATNVKVVNLTFSTTSVANDSGVWKCQQYNQISSVAVYFYG